MSSSAAALLIVTSLVGMLQKSPHLKTRVYAPTIRFDNFSTRGYRSSTSSFRARRTAADQSKQLTYKNVFTRHSKSDLFYYHYHYHRYHHHQVSWASAMVPELAPELLEIIFGHILADSRDTATLRACSLAFPHYTTLFQRALFSKKPLTLSFNRNTDKDPRLWKMINTLVDLLDVNPRFGALL